MCQKCHFLAVVQGNNYTKMKISLSFVVKEPNISHSTEVLQVIVKASDMYLVLPRGLDCRIVR